MASDRGQVEIEQAINNAISERAALLDANRSLISDQLAMARELCAALDCQDFEPTIASVGELNEGLREGADASEALSAQTADVNKEMKKATKTSFSWKAAGVSAFLAIKNAASGVFGILGSIGGVIKTGVMGAFNLVKMGMQAYNGMIDGLLQKGQELHNGTSALRTQMESLRGEFGNLAKGEGRSIIKAWDKVNDRGQKLSGTGLRMSRVFGSGSEGMAKMLEHLQEKASEMGGTFTRFAKDFEDAGEEIIIASKALGLSGEAMSTLALQGKAAGKTLKESLRELNKQVVQVSKKFDVNVKLTGKMLDAQLKAPGIFNTNTKEMLKTAVAAQKLGVSIETLTKTTKVFDDFESGAKAAGELAAQFGITVDAMDMMTATPAEQVTMLKDALQESGQSFADMSRQEKQRMSELTGMDVTELQNLMDPSNAFDSKAMDAVDKGVDSATAATMRQTKANRELAKAMERVVEQGEAISGKGGLLGTFLDGVSKGIGKSEEFRHIIKNIYEVFKIVDRAGQQVGMVLAELFGKGGPFYVVTQFFDEMFDPAKMQQKMDNIVGFFRDFVDTVMKGGEGASGAFTTLFNNIVDELLGGAGGTGDFIDMMLNGLEKAFDFIGASLIKFLPTILNGLTELFKLAIKAMTGKLKGPGFSTTVTDDGLFPMIQSALADPKLLEAWEGLAETFLEFIDIFWDKYGETISMVLGGIIAAIIGAALLQSLPIILASGAIGGLTKGLFTAIGSALPGAGTDNIPDPVSGDGGGGATASMAEQVKEIVEVLEQISPEALIKAGVIMVGIGVGLAVGVLAIIELAVHAQKRKASKTMMLTLAAVMFGVAKSAEAVGGLIKSVQGARIDMKSLGVVALVLVAMVAVVWAVSEIVVNTMEALSGIKAPPEGLVEDAGAITTTIMKVTAGIVVMAGVIAGIAILVNNPIIAVGIVLALGAAAAIFYGIAELVKEIVYSFSTVPETLSKKAGLAAEAASKLVGTLFEVLDLLMVVIRETAIDEDAFSKAATEVAAVTDILADKMMPAMMKAANMITEDPKIVREKIEIITMLMDSFAPIANLMSAALSIQDLKPEEVAGVVASVTGGIETVLMSIAGLVTGIIDKVGGLSETEVNAAKAAAPLNCVCCVFDASIPDANRAIKRRNEDGEVQG